MTAMGIAMNENRYTHDYAKAIKSDQRLLAIAQSFENRFLEAETRFHLEINSLFWNGGR